MCTVQSMGVMNNPGGGAGGGAGEGQGRGREVSSWQNCSARVMNTAANITKCECRAVQYITSHCVCFMNISNK